MLNSARLITLTGAGGIGKTRLAAEVVGRPGRAGADERRVYWVRLARLAAGADSAAVEAEIANAVIEVDYSGRSAGDALLDALTHPEPSGDVPRTVLVLDNCEHVLAGVCGLIADLLDAVPELTIVATSREPLGWIDEHLVAVAPLPHRNALELFQHRAELTGHTITEPDQISTAAAICRHVNNHPLYIQLAAARLRHQPLSLILQGLTGHADDTRLRWTHGGHGGTEPRHRTVTDVIAWSYDLRGDEERLLFDRLSVFAAGYATNPDDVDGDDAGADLDAIETICGDSETSARGSGGYLARHEIGELLERLVDRSLLSVHMTPTTVRYSMLESLRIFAERRLRERSIGTLDESARLAARHRRYYRDTVAHMAATWLGPREHEILAWARAAWDNIVTAIETSTATPGEAAVGLEICIGLLNLRLPFFRSSFREVRQWTERALQADQTSAPQPVELRIEAMALLVWIILHQGEADAANVMLDNCVAACLSDLGRSADWRRTALTDIGLPASVELAWGTELLLAESDPTAIVVLVRAREKYERLGNTGGEAMSRMFEAMAAGLLGTPEQAIELSRRNLDRATASGAVWLTSWARLNWSTALTKAGRPIEALDYQRRALTYQLAAQDRFTSLWAVQLRAWSLARIIEDSKAPRNPRNATLVTLATEIARLAGGLETQRAMLGIHIEKMGPFADESERAVSVARDILGPDAFAAARTQGARLRSESDDLQRLALGSLTLGPPPTKTTESQWHKLSATERQVAISAAAGWTNTAIAGRRGRSVRTIDAQISTILQKLGVASREHIIEHVPEDTSEQVRTRTGFGDRDGPKDRALEGNS
ncbi:LuxR C-terminal-related transcriptional regulator [Nocardia sp. NPDC005366]|uniref:ATP-binding protein n=1 Tax=Nocardia sp. NPDC005366 TaxID=3156878 RepID=UPI0033A48156